MDFLFPFRYFVSNRFLFFVALKSLNKKLKNLFIIYKYKITKEIYICKYFIEIKETTPIPNSSKYNTR